ncbi:MAG: hypothetical protein KBT41_06085 [bacterium]|nr:hypothetical protein [Candidatus Colousia faecequi]
MAENNDTPVVLKIDSFEDREVLAVDYKFAQATGTDGQIDGNPRGGELVIRVKARNDGNNQLVQWMLEPDTARDVEVSFTNVLDGSTMKSLKGKGCYCFRYVEKWEDGEMHYEEISIVCQELSNGNVEFKNKWA